MNLLRRIPCTRLLVVLLGTLCFLGCLIADAVLFFEQVPPTAFSLFRFLLSACIGGCFALIGSFTWLFADDRGVVHRLASFCGCIAVTFAVETGAASGVLVLSAISTATAAASILCFALLLLQFPRPWLTHTRWRRAITGGYIAGGMLCIGYALPVAYGWTMPVWALFYRGVLSLLLIGSLMSLILIARSTPQRERRELRVFTWGIIFSLLPLLLLTLLPGVFNLPIIDGQLSTAGFLVLPLTLGYVCLRSQLVVFDASVRRLLLPVACLFVLFFAGGGVQSLFLLFGGNTAFSSLLFVIFGGFIPFLVWGTRRLVDQCFFPELHTFVGLDTLMNQFTTLSDIADYLTLSCTGVFGAGNASVFVLDPVSGRYKGLLPARPADLQLMKQFSEYLFFEKDQTGRLFLQGEAAFLPILSALDRPVFFHEIIQMTQTAFSLKGKALLSRYLLEHTSASPLLAPIRLHNQMIGVVVLGERSNHHPYTGPDLASLARLCERCAPVVEVNRRMLLDQQMAILHGSLYNVSLHLSTAATTAASLGQFADQLARNIATATGAHVLLWRCDDRRPKTIHLVASAGSLSDHFRGLGELPWDREEVLLASLFLATFTPEVFPLLSRMTEADRAIAWLPVGKWVMSLLYQPPHSFQEVEQRLLLHAASHGAAALEYVEMREAFPSFKEQLANWEEQLNTHLETLLLTNWGYVQLLQLPLPPSQRSLFLDRLQQTHYALQETSERLLAEATKYVTPAR